MIRPYWEPKPYQEKGLALLRDNCNAGLFLDPGMGKTSVVLEHFRRLNEGPMFVFAPLRVASIAWPEELEKWANFLGLSYLLIHGPNKRRRMAEDVDIYLFNVEFLTTSDMPMLADLLERHDRPMLVLDESTLFKNPSSKRVKVMKELLPAFWRRVILTGTPMPNGVEGLWSQVYMLDEGGLLGKNITAYRNKFMHPNPDSYGWVGNPEAMEEVSALLAPVVFQLTADDYLDLPEYNYVTISVDMPTKAQAIYNETHKTLISELEKEKIVSANAAAARTRCRQIANGALYTGEGTALLHSAKVDALKEMLGELEGQSILLLYQFRSDWDRIHKLGSGAEDISGTSPAKARAMCARFVSGELPILAGHPASLGHGLNLQGGGAHNIIWFGPTDNLELWEQTNQRLRRQGNTAECVNIYTISSRKTVDGVIESLISRKDKSQKTFLKLLKGV